MRAEQHGGAPGRKRRGAAQRRRCRRRARAQRRTGAKETRSSAEAACIGNARGHRGVRTMHAQSSTGGTGRKEARASGGMHKMRRAQAMHGERTRSAGRHRERTGGTRTAHARGRRRAYAILHMSVARAQGGAGQHRERGARTECMRGDVRKKQAQRTALYTTCTRHFATRKSPRCSVGRVHSKEGTGEGRGGKNPRRYAVRRLVRREEPPPPGQQIGIRPGRASHLRFGLSQPGRGGALLHPSTDRAGLPSTLTSKFRFGCLLDCRPLTFVRLS